MQASVKTCRSLYPQVYAFESLYQAFRRARRGGKRSNPEVACFEYHLEEELWRLHGELRDESYAPGPYHNFYVTERKRRKISAAPFRDRVVHHTLCAAVEPIFERRFIHDSYACRTGKGTHRAADQAQHFARRSRYLLQCDVVQFFPSVDHAVLRHILGRTIADPQVTWLIDQILRSGAGVLASEYEMHWFPGDDLWAATRPRGLPIGNLTSQFWANVYLNELDQFVKRTLKCRSYVRYADDFLLFHDDKAMLHRWREEIIRFLEGLRLCLHERTAVISRCRDGFGFVGYRIFPDHRRLRRENVRSFARRLRRMRDACRQGAMTGEQVQQSIQSWVAHAAHADTWRLRERLFAEVVF